ncbi:MAG: hypothetical protein FWD54_05965 [Endomicrobia bacterium]|nr:hypothetical protein [Endomicrobiia bacterium]
MEPSQKNKKKWIIFGVIIAVIAILILVVPLAVTKYMRTKYPQPNNTVSRDLMIKVKGVIKQADDENKTVYLEGSENGLYYVLFGDKLEELTQNMGKTLTVFGNIYEPEKDKTINDKPVRMRIKVVNYDTPGIK